MFDNLIVSEPEEADLKDRRNYFIVSSMVVGVLFLAVVVFSIFASDYSLGSGSFELAELIAPTDLAAVEAPKPQAPSKPSRSNSSLPERQVNMVESPIVPPEISLAPNAQQARPDTKFGTGRLDTDRGTPGRVGRETPPSDSNGTLAAATPVEDNTTIPEPPPARAPVPVRAAVTQSLGVINGLATSLPKPTYPPPALAVNAQGKVDVQVLIDETGKVISAKAVSGNPLLRQSAEQAARNARFTPTYLSKVAVKVTGVIVYNFTRI